MTDGLDEAAGTATEHVAAAAVDPSAPAARARPSRKAALRPDAKPGHCANCGTALKGPVCHHCGQLDDEFHRPVRGLLGEIIEGLFAFDGRVARTIPNLMLRPGRVTRAYLRGQRARFMPPFRLYIIASLIFFLLAPIAGGSLPEPNVGSLEDAIEGNEEVRARIGEAMANGDLTPEDVETTRASFERLGLGEVFAEIEAAGDLAALEPQSTEASAEAVPGSADDPADADLQAALSEAEDLSPEAEAEVGQSSSDPGGVLNLGVSRGDGEEASFAIGDGEGEETALSIRRFLVPEDYGEAAPEGGWPYPVRSYLSERMSRIAEDPAGWLEEAADWVPRIMFVMVPVYALLLSLTYIWRRGYFLYDHLIVSVHFHAALFLSMTVFYLASYVVSTGWMVLAFLLYSNFYLYKLHRVVYGRSRITSVLRTLALDFVYAMILMVALSATLLLGAMAV